MADVSRYSFGKRLWTTAQTEGVRIDDQASLDAFIADFNARRAPNATPSWDRVSARGRQATGRFTPPGTRPKASSAKRRKRRR